MILLAVLGLMLGSCQKGLESSDYDETGSCTVLIYMVAENSLYSEIYSNIYDLLHSAWELKKGERVVLYVDDRRYPRMYIINSQSSQSSFSPVLEFTSDYNSCDVKTLDMVIGYTRALCPANEYGYVFWSHGSGWIPNHDTRSFGVDNQKNTDSNQNGFHMNLKDLAATLGKYGKARFVMFDACFMQSVESAYELRDVTDYVIGSPAEIPAYGAPYGLQLSHYFDEPFVPGQLSFDYWAWYNGSDMGVATSVISTAHLEQLAAATRRYIKIDTLSDKKIDMLLNYFHYDEWYHKAHYPDACDMRSIMKSELSESDYEEWMKSLRRAVPAAYCTRTWYSAYSNYNHRIDSTQYCGVSMYIPRTIYSKRGEQFYSDYYETAWYKALNGE